MGAVIYFLFVIACVVIGTIVIPFVVVPWLVPWKCERCGRRVPKARERAISGRDSVASGERRVCIQCARAADHRGESG